MTKKTEQARTVGAAVRSVSAAAHGAANGKALRSAGKHGDFLKKGVAIF